MSSVLTQDHGGNQRPVGYHSEQLDSVAKGPVCCLRAVAAAFEAVLVCADIVAMSQLTECASHCSCSHLTGKDCSSDSSKAAPLSVCAS